MAKFNQGINGPFSGKVGAVVGATWKGIPYMRSKGTRTAPPTDNEKESRNRFAITHSWLRPLLGFVREGYKNYSNTSFGFNAAKSYVLKNAFEEQDNVINPALVKLSAGNLPLPADIAAGKSGDKAITFTWDTSTPDNANAFDQVMLVAYNVEDKKSYWITTGQFRYTGSHTLPVSEGKSYHLYLAFNAVDRTRQSDSVYLGELEM